MAGTSGEPPTRSRKDPRLTHNNSEEIVPQGAILRWAFDRRDNSVKESSGFLEHGGDAPMSAGLPVCRFVDRQSTHFAHARVRVGEIT